MKKKVLSLFFVLCMVGGTLVGCGSSKKADNVDTSVAQTETAEKKTYKIRLSHLGSNETDYTLVPQEMVEMMNEKAGYEAFELEVYTVGQLGNSDLENCELVNNGTVEMSFTANDGLLYLNGSLERWNVVSIPFLFPSEAAANSFWNTEYGKDLMAEVADTTNVIVYPGFCNGYSILGSNKGEIHLPSDVAGQKIRTTASQFIMKSVESWEAASINVPYSETYSALQQGTVDGMINGLASWWGCTGGEVCKYGTRINSYYNINCPIVNKDWYNGLPENLKEIFDEGMEFLHERTLENWPKNRAMYEDALAAQGITIIDITDEERQVWVEATESVISELAAMAGGVDYVNEIRECVATLG